MQKVITINLNGNAYQLEETAYGLLRAYLDRAEQQLKDNPDKAEIISDLEQAIADKCNRVLGAQKTVMTTAEKPRSRSVSRNAYRKSARMVCMVVTR